MPPALDADTIRTTTEDVLRHHGPAKATVLDVARALGVSHASIHKHVSSKAALREAVTRRWLSRAHDELAAAASNTELPTPQRLRHWLTMLFAAKRAKAHEDPELKATYRHLVAEQALHTSLGEASGGAWFDAARGTLTVAATDLGQQRAVRDAGAIPTVVQHSLSELDGVKSGVDALAAGGAGVTGWYTDVASDSVVIEVHAAQRQDPAVQGFLDRAVRPEVSVAEVGALAIPFIGAVVNADAMSAAEDIGYGLIGWMNMISVLLLAPIVRKVIRDYDQQRRTGFEPVFDPHRMQGAEFWEHEQNRARTSGNEKTSP